MVTHGVLLLQDILRAHTSQVAMIAPTECGFKILPHPPYSPEMSPDFYLFPKLKSHLRGTQYGSNEGVKEVVNEYLGDQKKAYFERIRKLEQRLEIILKSNGQIFIPMLPEVQGAENLLIIPRILS